MTNATAPVERDSQGSRVVTERIVESSPARVIQIERVKVSDEHRASIAAAILAGRQAAGKE